MNYSFQIIMFFYICYVILFHFLRMNAYKNYYFNDNKNLLIISLVDGDGMIKTSKSWVLSNLVSREVRKSVNKCYRDWSNILMKTKNQELDIGLYC